MGELPEIRVPFEKEVTDRTTVLAQPEPDQPPPHRAQIRRPLPPQPHDPAQRHHHIDRFEHEGRQHDHPLLAEAHRLERRSAGHDLEPPRQIPIPHHGQRPGENQQHRPQLQCFGIIR